MILNFSEFNSLYESSNGLVQKDEYSNGVEIIEALLTVMKEKEVLSETEIATFLDNVLQETGYRLNTEVYENYAEWLADWSPFIDEGINESETELLFTLTRRGNSLLESGINVDSFNNQQTLIKVDEAMGGAATLGVGLTAKKRGERKAGFDAYRKHMGYDNTSGSKVKNAVNTVRSHVGEKLPSLPGTKRRGAKHAALGAYHAETSKRNQ